MDDTGNFVKGFGYLNERVNRSARRNIDFHGTHTETGIDQSICRRVGIFLPQIREHYVFARTDPPRNSLADRSSPDDDDNIFQVRFFHEVLLALLTLPTV
jgi:hypothetical protein